MTARNPYALLHAQLRPYWKGYSHEQDLKLMRRLFFGTAIPDKRGRERHGYWNAGSPQEREGFEALQRLLSDSDQEAIAVLCNALSPDNKAPRQLVFKQKQRGRADPTADSQIAVRVLALESLYGTKPESVIKQVQDEFGLSRSSVLRAVARNKKNFPQK
jgi:hypothetical protein